MIYDTPVSGTPNKFDFKNHPKLYYFCALYLLLLAHEIPTVFYQLVKLDFGLMEQVLFNLLSNAIRHTPEGTAITVTAQCTEKEVVIQVSDAGPGFPKKDMDQVFEKFYRSGATHTKGIGLGLSIVKGFIAAHHGTITVENMPGNAAHFTIKIPSEMNYLKATATIE